MSNNLKAVAAASNLNPKEKKEVDGLFAALDAHRELLSLPSNEASQRYQTLSSAKQASLKNFFGEDEEVNGDRGWLQSAAHYTRTALANTVGKAFAPFNEASDLMTRAYRTVSISLDQGMSLGDAWTTANDKGDKVFRPRLIDDAKAKFGAERVELAMRLAARDKWADVFGEASDEGKKILSDYRAGNAEGLFIDALEAVDQAKYSPGRDLAGMLGLRGTGAYKWVAGLGDATFRIAADPFILAGKAKRMYDVANYSLRVIEKGGKVAEVFAKPGVQAFWNEYGPLLGQFNAAQEKARKATSIATQAAKRGASQEFVSKAQAHATKALEDAAALRTQMRRIAPEFGDTTIKELASKRVGVRDAKTAQNFFLNNADAFKILDGQAGRANPLMPRLDAARKARISLYTATDKVFDLNKIGPDFLRTAYVSDTGLDDIVTGIVNDPTQAAETIKKALASNRYSMTQVQRRVDAFAAKFEKIPFAEDGLDFTSANAATQVYRIARLSLPRYQSKLISEAFDVADLGKKKEIYNSLWETVMNVRGVNKTPGGQAFIQRLRGVGEEAYAPRMVERDEAGNVLYDGTPGIVDGKPMAVGVFQLSDYGAMPSLQEMDAFAARDGIFGKIMGFSHRKGVQRAIDYWSFFTLAGPRFAVRNAAEDMMMHLAVGTSPFDIAKGRMMSTTMRLIREGHDVGVLNRFVLKSERGKYAAKLDAIKSSDLSDTKKLEATRELMAEAIAKSKIASFKTEILGKKISVFSDDEIKFIQEQIRVGNLDDALGEVAEGGRMAMRAGDRVTRAVQDQKRNGTIVALQFDNTLWERRGGKNSFTSFAPAANTAGKVGWFASINVWSKDELGRIAMPLLDGNGNRAAVNAVAEHLRANPQVFNKFRAQARNLTEQEHAETVVRTVANLFSKQDGRLNKAFYRQVVDAEGNIHASKLTMENLPTLIEDIPAFIAGPTYVPIAEGDNIAAAMLERGWDWMGEMNARYSREPIMLATMLDIRKDMAKTGFDQQYIAARLKNVPEADVAKETLRARKALAEYVEQKSIAYTLSYIDNPNVRTQLAFASRNFSRFYRATEDFYRRVARSVRYNPAALAKASLTYDGIAHSGWVQQDENGESYFLYPGLAPVYKATQAALALFGQGTAFKAPLAVQFGGKLSMVTPSADPDSLFPTFAGPLGAFTVKSVANVVGWFDPDAKAAVEKLGLGPYAEGRGMIESLLPAHINRAYAALNRDERNSQWASAFRKAATYSEAAGLSPKPKIDPETGEQVPPTPAELEKYKDQLTNMTAGILGMRWLLGMIVPASPQLDYKSDMADWMRNSGVSSFKKAFNALVTKYDNDYDRAMLDWVKYYPNELPYTVGENQKMVNAAVGFSKQAGDFFAENKDLFERYPEGAAYLMPLKGDFTYDTWKMLKNNGYYASKPVGDFLREVQSAGDYALYRRKKDEYEEKLKSSPYDWDKKNLRAEWEAWSSEFRGARPLLQERLANYATIQPRQAKALGDLMEMLDDPNVKVQPKTQAALKKMSSLYLQYKSMKENPYTDEDAQDVIKDGIVKQMREIAAINPNAGAAFSGLFSSLMGVSA